MSSAKRRSKQASLSRGSDAFRPSSDEFATEPFVDVPADLRRSRCGMKLDPNRSVVSGKAAGVWRCSKCNTRGVQSSRLPTWKPFATRLRGFHPDQEVEEFVRGRMGHTYLNKQGHLERQSRQGNGHTALSLRVCRSLAPSFVSLRGPGGMAW